MPAGLAIQAQGILLLPLPTRLLLMQPELPLAFLYRYGLDSDTSYLGLSRTLLDTILFYLLFVYVYTQAHAFMHPCPKAHVCSQRTHVESFISFHLHTGSRF